jgi:NAD(P)-dependent dehydrogenase (short-subunit alcohol dehydrogenase family)
MTIRLAVDVATRVSPELSAIIERLTDDADRDELPTLDDVRAAVEEADGRDAEDERRHPQDRTSVVAELDDLIEEFGGDALAVDFIVNKASEGLSRIIETAMSDPSLPRRPTLRVVREAMASGLTARLVGDGTIDPDEDGTLLAEIDGLIVHFGPNAMAENFVRFE